MLMAHLGCGICCQIRRNTGASLKGTRPAQISTIAQPQTITRRARQFLRHKYLEADVGLTGANFVSVESGRMVLVTNEGNGDLTQTLPKVHIVLASIEKLVPTLEDFAAEYARWRREEREKMWPHVWQFAAREEDIPEAGDYTVFEIAGRSYLVSRQDDESILLSQPCTDAEDP